MAEKDGTPIYINTLGRVAVGHQVRLGKVGIDDRDDVVEGVVLLQRGYKALSVLETVRAKVEDLNAWKLPDDVKVRTFYDRTKLIHTTVETVTDILISGMVLVFVILVVFLGHFRAALIVALTIPLSPLFTFTAMILIGQSANLISLGAIDFGIIVDATQVMVESIFFHLAHGKVHGLTAHQQIVRAARQVGRPIFFATAIIVMAAPASCTAIVSIGIKQIVDKGGFTVYFDDIWCMVVEAQSMPFTSESLRMSRELIRSNIIRTSRNPSAPARGNIECAGDISTELEPYQTRMLKPLLGAVSTVGTTHTFTIGSLPEGLTIEKQFTDIDQYVMYTGCKVNSLRISCKASGLIETTYGVMAAEEHTATTTTGLEHDPQDWGRTPFGFPPLP